MDETKSDTPAEGGPARAEYASLAAGLSDLVGRVHIIQLPKHAVQADRAVTTRGAHTIKHWPEMGIPHTIHAAVNGLEKYYDSAKHGKLSREEAAAQMAALTSDHPFMERVSGYLHKYAFGSVDSTDVLSKCATIGVCEAFAATAKRALELRGSDRWIAIAEDDVQITAEGATHLAAALKCIPEDASVLQLGANCLAVYGYVPEIIDEHWCRVRLGTGGMMYLIKVPEDNSTPPFVKLITDMVDSVADPASSLAIDPVDVALQQLSEAGQVVTTRFGCITSFTDVDGDKSSSDTIGFAMNYADALASDRWRKCCTSAKSAQLAELVSTKVVKKPEVGRKKTVINDELYEALKLDFSSNNVASSAESNVDATQAKLVAAITGHA